MSLSAARLAGIVSTNCVKGASGHELAAMWSGLYDTVEPFMSQAAMRGLDVTLTDNMVENGLPGFAHSVLRPFSTELEVTSVFRLPREPRQQKHHDIFPFRFQRHA